MRIINLKTLHVRNPLCIDRVPYFSWMLESEERNTKQISYAVTVKDEKNNTVWDSGRVDSDKTSFVAYEGAELQNTTLYTWSVHVWDNHNNDAIATASFGTGFFKAPAKKAKWICMVDQALIRQVGFGNQPPATCFRRSFHVSETPARAWLYATAHGGYALTLNQKAPDDRHLATEFSTFDKVHLYQCYDLTPLVHIGNNVLDVTVGDGWYCCPKMQLNKDYTPKQHALLYKLQLVYADGHEEWVDSDSKTMSAYGPVRSADIFAGELYDARCALSQDTEWANCEETVFEYANLAAQIDEGIRPVQVIPVEKLYVSPKGETILDFGQNMAGVVRFKTHLKSGQSLTLDHFEETDKDGNYFNSIAVGAGAGGGCEQRVQYISDGTEAEYTPRFTFHGFRYAKVTAPDGYTVKAEDFEALPLSSYKELMGSFSCSDPRLNRLYQNTMWSQRSNMIAIPTDCPQREKAGWTGDIAIYAKTALLNEDATPFLSRWLLSLSAEQQENGAVPITVPFGAAYKDLTKTLSLIGLNRGAMGVCGWGDAATMVPWAMYEITGDTDILAKQYDTMKKWAEYIIHSCKRRGSLKNPAKFEKYLWNTGFHFGDWLIPSLAKNGYDLNILKAVLKTKKIVAPLFGYNTMCIMRNTAQLLGNTEDCQRYGQIADRMKTAIQETMIPANGRLRNEFMGAYVLLLAFGVVPENKVKLIGDQLIRMLDENGGCLDTGFLGTPYLLDALCISGHTDRAYQLLMQEKCPSWLYEVKKGATTIWESWFSYNEENQPLVISFNHFAFGCVDDWMFRYIGGVTPKESGFRHFEIRIPKEIVEVGITEANREYLSENGRIACRWSINNGKLSLWVKVPCNTTADIHLWDGSVHSVGSGEYCFD